MSVLTFLTLRELAAALSVSKAWSGAVQFMRPAMLSAHIRSCGLNALLSSPSLRRHVAELGKEDAYGQYQLQLLPAQLPELTSALPQLRALNACLDCLNLSADGDAPILLLFPPHLQSLHLSHLHVPRAHGAALANPTQLLTSIGHLQRLHSLRLRLYQNEAHVSFKALQQPPLLHDLCLKREVPIAPVQQFAAEMRALSWLHRLRIVISEATQKNLAALLQALLREAPEQELRALQWRYVTLNGLGFTDELTPLLCRLPLLERLDARLNLCSRFDFLSALPHLTHLELHLWHMHDDAWRNLLGVFTSDGLARLHTLVLRGGPCISDDLGKLLSHTPSLTNLMLDRLATVSSLAFFKAKIRSADAAILSSAPWPMGAARSPLGDAQARNGRGHA